MDCYERMKETIEAHGLVGEGDALLLMVSGGSDSTALAHLMARLRDEGSLGALDMLHVNHKLRGEDADADAAFVARLADRLHVPLFMCEIDIAGEAARSGENVEAVARRERYAAAEEAVMSMCQHEAIPLSQGRIVTAHTVDDRIENFYMRSIVGTGPGGFRSMLYRNGRVVRPLLDCTREGLRNFLTDLAGRPARADAGIPAEGTASEEPSSGTPPKAPAASESGGELWREDATNAHTDRFRAYVRHKIVPAAREWNPGIDATLGRTMNLIAEEDDMLDGMADSIVEQDTEMLGDEPCDGFLLLPRAAGHPRPLLRRVVHKLLKPILGMETRIDAATVNAVLDGFADGRPAGGYVANIQGDLAVSANKGGVRVEPMPAFRARRKRGAQPRKENAE